MKAVFKSIKIYLLLFPFMGFIMFLNSCRKDEITTDPSDKLSFSNDSVYFDTVFTSLSSVTQRFRVYNPNDKKVNISSIRLAGGNSSMFRLNVDGVPGSAHQNIEIEPGDSIFVFAEVTIDPNNESNPFVVADSVLFETNGNIQKVQLVAYGRNADFYRPTNFPSNGFPAYSVLDGSQVWTNDKPKVIIGYLVVDSAQTLTIEAGTQIYLYNNSGIWVYKQGTLIVNGTLQDSVVFQGVRKESYYQEEPGQWDRIWINQGSSGNKINYAVIKNGNIGIQAEDVLELGNAPEGQLELSNTRIRNMRAFGIYGVNYTIRAWNTMVSNCGAYGLALIRGGSYDFRHCTFANYWSENVRTEPSVFLSNAQSRPDNSIAVADMNFVFKNGIVYGNLQSGNELSVEFLPDAASNWVFKNSLLKIDNPDINTSDPAHFIAMRLNEDPLFVDADQNNYRLTSASPARNWGLASIVNEFPPIPEDLLGQNRLGDEAPDVGAIEFIP
jgi:hypothetical protein